MSSIDDLANIAQNLVTAISGLNQSYLNISGAATYENITASTLVKKGSGRVARVSVLVTGSSSGTVYDAASVGLAGTANRVFVISNTATGVQEINMPVSNGIVVEPGTGMEVSVSYS